MLGGGQGGCFPWPAVPHPRVVMPWGAEGNTTPFPAQLALLPQEEVGEDSPGLVPHLHNWVVGCFSGPGIHLGATTDCGGGHFPRLGVCSSEYGGMVLGECCASSVFPWPGPGSPSLGPEETITLPPLHS